MYKHLLFTLLVICSFVTASAQQVDTVITNQVYTSYFNNHLHEPLYVVYKLYKGGGGESRKGMTFKTGGLDSSATADDYKASGYDEGHLCNAEDEAFDKQRLAATFRFYNCVPQTPRLNRGIWKVWETAIRKESQGDSLLVICGGLYGKEYIGYAAVPEHCFKLVYSLSKHSIMHLLLFPNDNSDTVGDITLDGLIELSGYKLKELLQ